MLKLSSYMRRTKIIATVGPASDSDQLLDGLIAAGVDIFRLNFSHGTHASQSATFKRVRDAAARARRDVAILQDLGGPKIRTGATRDGRPIAVKTGDRLRIVTGDQPCVPGVISTTFAGLAKAVKPGDSLLIADGLVELRVESTDGSAIDTAVVEGGEIGDHKGINAPGVPLPASALTPKDVDDLALGLSLGVDMIALSFVQSATDIDDARRVLIQADADDLPIIAKLERPQALDHLAQILAACDGVMVARGDLGLELPLEKVPTAQKAITRMARLHGKPVIVATQVLESMTVEPRPTRAEVSDAANAVDDGVDAIMLAGETAVGANPARVALTLDAIIRDAERSPSAEATTVMIDRTGDGHEEAICDAAVTLATRGSAQAIVAVTRGGGTARRLSALRPQAPIFATTDRDDTARRLALYWGVAPLCTQISEDVAAAGTLIGRDLVARGLVEAGACIVLVSISADLARTDANYLKIQQV
jgi:pyruvate kinase